MMRKTKSEKQDGAPKKRRLREIAKEASERLETVLADGEVTRAVEELAGAGEAEDVHGGVEGGGARDGVGPADPPARRAIRRRSSRSLAPVAGRPPCALVSHAFPGVARILANLLEDMGLATSIVSTPEQIEAGPERNKWDIVFLQGSPMPYPCKSLVKTTLERCVSEGMPVVLVMNRGGDATAPHPARTSARGSLEWPFEPARVRKEIGALIRGIE